MVINMATNPITVTDPNTQLQALVDLVFNPSQTPQQLQAGEYTLLQLRELLHGNHDESIPRFVTTRDNVVQLVPQFANVTQNLEDTRTLITRVEANVHTLNAGLAPVLQQADDQIKKLKETETQIKSVIDAEARRATERNAGQETAHTELIRHAEDKFEDLESHLQAITRGAQDKFIEWDSYRMQFETAITLKMCETDAKLSEVTKWLNLFQGMAEQDVIAARAKLSENMGGNVGGNRGHTFRKEIWEYRSGYQS